MIAPRQRAQQIGPADNADDRSILDDRHALDAVAFERFGETSCRPYQARAVTTFFVITSRTRRAFCGRIPAPNLRVPSRPAATTTGGDRFGLDVPHQVAFADDADQIAGGFNDGKAADTVIEHESGSVLNRLVRRKRRSLSES